jgi:predicted DNA-binding ArsR family transcriptional regulator
MKMLLTLIMAMNGQQHEFPYVTVEEASENFDFIMTLVERGQTFLIKSEKGNVILAPYREVKEVMEDVKTQISNQNAELKLDVTDQLSEMLDEQLTNIPI